MSFSMGVMKGAMPVQAASASLRVAVPAYSGMAVRPLTMRTEGKFENGVPRASPRGLGAHRPRRCPPG